MTKEMVVAANRHETKVAVLEDDQLVEVYFQRANEYSLAGSIHKGRVTRVLPGMQSAFVDLGLERDTFLYVSDFFEENDEYDQIPTEREPRSGRGSREQRAPREERPVREEVSEPAAPEPVAVVSAESVPSAEAVAESAEAAVSSEPASGERVNRSERGDQDRDRHRRSRRRRNRGRGFPESKYATPSHTPVEKTPAETPEPEAPPAVESGYDFAVLPGESLAKYRHTAVPTLDSGEQEEFGAESAAAEHAAEQAIPEELGSDGNGSELDLSEVEIATESADDPDAEELTDREVLVTGDAEVDELVAEALEEAATEAEPLLEGWAEPSSMHEPTIEASSLGGALGEEASEPTAAPSLVVEPHAPEQAGEEGETTPQDQAVASAESAAEAASAEPVEGPALSGPAEAAVRSNGGRYVQHRISRRMRRKMRSQGRGEGESRRETESAPIVSPETPKLETSRPEPRQEVRVITRPEKGVAPSITDLLKEGQEILVQIAKEPLGQKGARITSHIALPGRYVVYMPTLEHMGVSRKIASDEERLRLKRILQSNRAGIQGGYIVRTAGEGKSEDEIAADMNFLANLWIDIRQKAEKRPAPTLLHHDLDIVQRLLRDQLTENFKAIWVDNEEVYESILRFVQRFQPALVSRVKLYTRPAPIFDAFNITPELEKALRPKVWLKSGGYIVINQTEALVAIDVNTGKFVGKSNRLEDTIVKTNTEAVKEIVRQIRLRDLGGIIVVDFIDMDERKNRQKVMQALEEAMRADKAPYKILQFNDFGLVAITRKRVKQSLERALCMPCPYCEGAGYVKSVQTIIGEILQEAQKIAAAVEGENNVILRVNPEVAKTLKSTQNKYLEELEGILRRPVLVKGDPLLHHEKFDLA